MSNIALSPQSQQVIQNYLSLPFKNRNINCPYFNNKRSRVRGALGVLIGKGTPEEIADEARLVALREKVDLKNLNEEQTKKFLVEHNLGVDCSGLVYHVLNAELNARKLGPLRKYIKRPWVKSPLRKLIALLRPAENTGVNTFFNDINTKEIKLSEIQAGDLIIMMNTGVNHNLHHVLLVHEVQLIPRNEVTRDLSMEKNVEKQNINIQERINSGKDSSLATLVRNVFFTHSFQYPDDGLYNHGVRQEKIEIIDPNKNIFEQNWSEPRMREYAKTAREIKIKRLKVL